VLCDQCGNAVPEDVRVCNHCGTAITRPIPVSARPPSPPAETAVRPEQAQAIKRKAVPAAVRLLVCVKNILLSPSTQWEVIASEPSSSWGIYVGYVAPLAAVGAIATFINDSVVGVGAGFLGTYRAPIGIGLIHALLSCLFSFLGVYLIALIVNALAPIFGGQRDALRALKVVAFSCTPAWIGSALYLVPAVGAITGILAGLYGAYLLYVGLPVLMRCPRGKAIGYALALTLGAFVLWLVLAGASTLAVSAARSGTAYALDHASQPRVETFTSVGGLQGDRALSARDARAHDSPSSSCIAAGSPIERRITG
jgi:hypothetical protein